MTTTFQLARKAGACKTSYRAFAEYVGGIEKYGKDTPIQLGHILDVLGFNDALWCLRCTQVPEKARKLSLLLAGDYAERVLYLYELEYPFDSRPRDAISATRLYAEDKIKASAMLAAGDAAWLAGVDAAGSSAGEAARSAAWTAARLAPWEITISAARSAARSAAWAEAWATALYADRVATWETARKAETAWQINRFLEVICQ